MAFLLLFPEQETNKESSNKAWKKVKVYFGKLKLNIEEYDNYSGVFPVTRWVDSAAYPPVAALRELLEGATEEEKKEGYHTNIDSGTALAGLWVEDGIARVTSTGRFWKGGGACCVIANEAQIKATLRQFGNI